MLLQKREFSKNKFIFSFLNVRCPKVPTGAFDYNNLSVIGNGASAPTQIDGIEIKKKKMNLFTHAYTSKICDSKKLLFYLNGQITVTIDYQISLALTELIPR
ncbi:MAG: hypothetical protein HQK53_05480 [Oligoflexia bacterium]|nr:hypothetical protein [Oligoflexia bacterium]